jgi:hypothetical protein
MRCTIRLAAVAFVVATPVAQAQQQGAPTAMMMVTWADVGGDWVGNAVSPTGDSVVTPLTFTFNAADKMAWMKFPNREPVPARVITMGGDSVVVQAGPYPSVARAGHTVTVTSVLHVRSHMLWGLAHGVFDDGQVLDSKVKANHQMH